MSEGIIDVAMVTWPNHPKRLAYLRETLNALDAHLYASRHSLRFYLSAESQRDPAHPWLGDELEELCRDRGITMGYRDAPANLGANHNAAMRMGTGEFIHLQQDDWRLEAPLDLSPGADLLDGYRDIDIVRYSWPGGPSSPTFLFGGPEGWRLIDLAGKWPYGDDPHLRRRDFMDRWGWYYDGGLHGTASQQLMKTLVVGGARIVAADRSYYNHFGHVSSVIDDVRAGKSRRAEA
ncbi:MAG TPA: hypothetical protein VM118_09895 [Acidobacteriota bacterium]|nr:hypothetical protein [Acidobacteriota bacterium]